MKKLYQSSSKKEKTFVWGLIVFLIVLLAVPYIYLYVTTPAGYSWSGLHVLTPGDYNHYFGYFEQVQDGNYLFIDHYTTEDQTRNILRPEWLVSGLLTRIPGLNNILVLQIVRSLLIIPFIWLLYLFVSYFFKSFKKRLTVSLFAVFATGVGAYILPFMSSTNVYVGDFYQFPMDLWTPEINVFLTLFNTPHLIYSLFLILFVLLSLFLGWEKKKLRYFIYAAVAANLLIVSHPFHLPTIFGVSFLILVYMFIQKRKLFIKELGHYLIFIAACLPALAYLFYIFVFDNLAQIRSAQNICLTSSLHLTIASFGFLLPLAIAGIVFVIKKRKTLPDKMIYLVIWAVFQFILIYSPVHWQRRMVEGLSIPLVFLSVIAIYYFAAWLKKNKKKFYKSLNSVLIKIVLFVLLFFVSNIYVYSSDFSAAENGIFYMYLPESNFSGFDWLEQNAIADEIVLTDLFTGSYLPAWTGLRVYAGHGVETANYETKKVEIILFFSKEQKLKDKLEFLSNNQINYVFYSSYPVELAGRDSTVPSFLGDKDYFKLVFDQEETKIYQVINYSYQPKSPTICCGCR